VTVASFVILDDLKGGGNNGSLRTYFSTYISTRRKIGPLYDQIFIAPKWA